MITQLNPAFPVITPKGKALAHFIIDDGVESDLKWVCFQENTGECWTWKNRSIRAQKNITEEREHITPFYNPDDVALKNDDDDENEEYKKTEQYNEWNMKGVLCRAYFIGGRIKLTSISDAMDYIITPTGDKYRPFIIEEINRPYNI